MEKNFTQETYGSIIIKNCPHLLRVFLCYNNYIINLALRGTIFCQVYSPFWYKNMKILKTVGGTEFVIDDDVHVWAKDIKWRLSSYGYVSYREKDKRIFLHRLIMQTPEDMVTDHINGNKLDNLKLNLRVTSDKLNRLNSGKRCYNTSGFKGVWLRKNGRWQAEIKLNGKKYSLGTYETKEESALAYNIKAKELFGEHARLNSL